MKIQKLAKAAGLLTLMPLARAWWGLDLWNSLFGSEKDEGPIAFRKMNDSENFSDRCRPSDDCWPSESEWDALDEALGGKLLRDVKPYLEPCYNPLS